MAKNCDYDLTEAENQILSLLQASINSFDHEAAETATPEQSKNMLKVLKHYVRAIKGGSSVNADLKLFLNSCAIQPEIPGSVAGGFKFALDVLKTTHTKCRGKDCVAKHRQKKAQKKDKKKVVMKALVDKDQRKSVKQPGVRVNGKCKKTNRKPAKSESSCNLNENKKDLPSYFI